MYVLCQTKFAVVIKGAAKHQVVTKQIDLSYHDLLYSLNFSREKIFTDFMVLSQTVKILTIKYLSKHLPEHTFSLRNALSPQKIVPK